MSKSGFLYVDFEESPSTGNIRLYLKNTTILLGSFIDHQEGLRTAGIVDRAICEWEMIRRRSDGMEETFH